MPLEKLSLLDRLVCSLEGATLELNTGSSAFPWEAVRVGSRQREWAIRQAWRPLFFE